MSTVRENLIKEAEDAITAVFSDQSVSQEETAIDLSELQGLIDTMLESMNGG